MKTMMNGMNVKPTGKPDEDFARMMIPHHQGAIDMAKVELQYGTDTELRQLATDIVAAQDKEIAQMKAWLAEERPVIRQRSRAPGAPYGARGVHVPRIAPRTSATLKAGRFTNN